MCARIGAAGAALIGGDALVLTHCNAGALATGGIGHRARADVHAARGRPAGRRSWPTRRGRCCRAAGSPPGSWRGPGVPVTVIADGMAASRLRRGDVTCVIVGADRIAANGDVANKIGTYGVALAARAHGVPFYVAAPSSTVDPGDAGRRARFRSRSGPPRRSPRWRGHAAAPDGVRVWNPGVRRDAGRAGDRDHHRPRRVRAGGRGVGSRRDARPAPLDAFHPRPRPGHHRLHRAAHASGRQRPRPGLPRVHPALSPSRLGRARSRGDRARLARGDARGAGRRAASGRPGIGITNQRETVVLWDRRTLAPVGPRDRLAGPPHQRALPRAARGRRRDRCSASAPAWWPIPISPPPSSSGCCATRHSAAAPERGELAAGTVESWLVARLTGGRVHVTDHTNASRTLLYNLAARDWDPELLELFGVPREMLPDIVPSAGTVARDRRRAPGLEPADRRARRRPAGRAVRPGLLHGRTGQEHLRHRRVPAGLHRRAPADAARRACWPPPPADRAASRPTRSRGACSSPAPPCSGCATGSGLIQTAGETEALARSVPDTGGVHFVPGVRGARARRTGRRRRAAPITGLTRGTTRAHLVRAALEAMAFSSAELLAGDGGCRRHRGAACSGSTAARPPTTG